MELNLDAHLQLQIPRLDLQHLKRLSTSVGIIQHAKYAIPDFHHGYSIDDNARALMLCNLIQKIDPSQQLNPYIDTYLSYIYYMQTEDGQFRNFLSFQHQYLDTNGTPDALGRTIWALGSLIKNSSSESNIELSLYMFDKALPHVINLKSIKAVAYSLCGLVLAATSNHRNRLNLDSKIIKLTQFLMLEYKQAKKNDWLWFEPILCYDNGIVPYSLFISYDYLNQIKPVNKYNEFDNSELKLELNELLHIAIESASFLDKILFESKILNLIGNQNWYKRGEKRSYIGQQVVDIPGLILCYTELEKRDLNFARENRKSMCFAWLLGHNKLGKSLLDPQTMGCFDGLEENEINLNQGAESVISFWQAYVYYFYHIT
ncbi:MAG: hypothetical protein EOO99_08580 [Pedobacter sp.]|nr:MAG: hypothetical protein EOO99_08580 [Pedobacter sp.]